MPSESQLDALKPHLGTVLDLLAEGMGASWIREFLETEHGIGVEDAIWAEFLRRHVPAQVPFRPSRHMAYTIPEPMPEDRRARLMQLHDELRQLTLQEWDCHQAQLSALVEAYREHTADVTYHQLRCADTLQAVRALTAEVARWRRWRWKSLVLAVFAGSLCGTMLCWLLRGLHTV
jgi:hypothetical protein